MLREREEKRREERVFVCASACVFVCVHACAHLFVSAYVSVSLREYVQTLQANLETTQIIICIAKLHTTLNETHL